MFNEPELEVERFNFSGGYGVSCIVAGQRYVNSKMHTDASQQDFWMVERELSEMEKTLRESIATLRGKGR